MPVSLRRGALALLALFVPAVSPGMVTQPVGEGVPFGNAQPSLGLRHLINIGGGPDELGEVALYAAGAHRPAGWVEADGRLLTVDQNADLFGLLGNRFGGEPGMTFALPDLRGRTMIGAGTGPGLPTYELGDDVGAETITGLTNVAPHGHDLGSGLMTDVSGIAQSHSNLQPSLALTPIIATQGRFPSRSVVTGSATADEGPQPIGSPSGEPFLGEIAWLAHDTIPSGWALADGASLSINNNEALFSILGKQYGGDGRTNFALPDLRGRAAMGAESSGDLGDLSGAPTEVMTLDKLPVHTHELPGGLGVTGPAGGSQPQSHLQPTQKLTPLVSLVGRYPEEFGSALEEAAPSSDGLDPAELGNAEEPYLGSVIYFAGNFDIRGWARADGAALPINQYTALFSLVWTGFGGDGRTTFRLPDLTDRLAVGTGQGDGLSDRFSGQVFGAAESVLTIANLPPHDHAYTVPGDYNNDGRVDAADYTLWRVAVGQPAGFLSNDIDGGPIGQAQYATWAANYGRAIGFPAPSSAVPEPTTQAVLLTVAAATSLRARQRQREHDSARAAVIVPMIRGASLRRFTACCRGNVHRRRLVCGPMPTFQCNLASSEPPQTAEVELTDAILRDWQLAGAAPPGVVLTDAASCSGPCHVDQHFVDDLSRRCDAAGVVVDLAGGQIAHAAMADQFHQVVAPLIAGVDPGLIDHRRLPIHGLIG